ncbi:MAG: peptide ABC transporter substrate-binding protein, partial [Phycisphaerae bacterium]
YFLDLVAFSVFLPVHAASLERFKVIGDTGLIYYDEQWAKPGNTHYNGPFMIQQWRFKRSIRLRKNPYYWDRSAVKLQTIEIIDVADANTAWLMYESGRVDWLSDLTTDFAPELIAMSRSPLPGALNSHTANARRNDVHVFPAFGTYFYNFNCTERLPDGRPNPFRDRRLRQAFTQAVDRQELVRRVVRLGNRPATAFIPPGSIPGYPAVRGLGYDVARARRLLAEAGYPDGRGLPEITILFNSDRAHSRIAQAVAAMWQRNLGVRVRMQAKEGKVFREDKANVRFMICRAGWYGDYGDPTTFLDVFRTGNGNNDSGFADPYYDRLLDQAERQPTPAARLARLAEAERYLVNQALPLLPLYHYVNIFAFDPQRVQNIYLTPRMMTMLKYVQVRR